MLRVSAKTATDGKTQWYSEHGQVLRPSGRFSKACHPIAEIDPRFPAAGGIGLQAHAPWKQVRFHDIRIRELTGR